VVGIQSILQESDSCVFVLWRVVGVIWDDSVRESWFSEDSNVHVGGGFVDS
jgi:hypothetical protein